MTDQTSAPKLDEFIVPAQSGPSDTAEIAPRVSRSTGFDPQYLDDQGQNLSSGGVSSEPDLTSTRLGRNDPMNPETVGEEPPEIPDGVGFVEGEIPQGKVHVDTSGGLEVKFGTKGVYLYNQETGAIFPFESAMATHPKSVVIGGAAVRILNKNSRNKTPLIATPHVNPEIERHANKNGVIVPVQQALERLRGSMFVAPATGANRMDGGSADPLGNFSVTL